MPDVVASDAPVISPGDLELFFHKAAKAPRAFRVGVEQEKLPVRSDGGPVPYPGVAGIGGLLRRLEDHGFVPVTEGGHVLGLEREAERITLEPGGQVELSGPALPSAAACREALHRHVTEFAALARPLDIRFIAGGFHPFGRLEDVPWLPKRRYEIMRDYLPRHGRLGHEMMKRTATVQVNLDFSDEADATDKIRTALGVTSVVTALYSASPLSEGRPNGYKSYRAAVWLDTDEDRCGLLPFAFTPGFGFSHYVQWALDVPMFFVFRRGQHFPVEALTFRRFLKEGWAGERATMADWALHLSTLFPEVRLKRTIELRGADAAPGPFADALAALWRGLLDDRDARSAAWALVADASFSEREALRREVPRAGLAARLCGRPLAEIAVELCRVADEGLKRLPAGADDRPLLDPLLDYARRARCPADDMLADFHRLGGNPALLVEAWELFRG
jgi:glutamate--cysteine ligase